MLVEFTDDYLFAKCAAITLLLSPAGLQDELPPEEEVVQPKRLLHQIHTHEELLHGHLDTRVREFSAGAQVSEPVPVAKCKHLCAPQIHRAQGSVLTLSIY